MGRWGRLRTGRHGGVVLDLILAVAFVLLGAFVLDRLGISFADLLRRAGQFFGVG